MSSNIYVYIYIYTYIVIIYARNVLELTHTRTHAHDFYIYIYIEICCESVQRQAGPALETALAWEQPGDAPRGPEMSES